MVAPDLGRKVSFIIFGSTGLGWVFSQERFIKGIAPFISFGKLRGSYGTVGNDQIGDYIFMNLYGPVSVGVPYQATQGLSTNAIPNPYLQWEETRKLQVGIDLGFLKDRISLTADYVNNRSSNCYCHDGLPSITGFATINANFSGTIQNTAWEFSLNTVNVKGKEFQWKTSVTFTSPKNELIQYPPNASGLGNIYFIGQPIGITSVFKFLGVNPATGVYQFADSHGNPTSNPSYGIDNTVKINASFPTYYGGFGNSFSFKGLTLDLFFHFVKQIKPNAYLGLGNVPGFTKSNQPSFVLDRWKQPGNVTNIQRYNSDNSLYDQYSYAISSDISYSDASFIRLKNLALSYQFTGKWLQKASLQNARLYLQGQNLLTISGYKGMDPETVLRVCHH